MRAKGQHHLKLYCPHKNCMFIQEDGAQNFEVALKAKVACYVNGVKVGLQFYILERKNTETVCWGSRNIWCSRAEFTKNTYS